MCTANPETTHPDETVRAREGAWRRASCCPGAPADGDEAPSCPMRAMFEGWAGKARPGLAFLILIPVVILLGLAALIVVEPVVLAWLAAALLALLGFALLRLTFVVRHLLARYRVG